MAICKSRNEKSGNGMRGMMETRGIRVGKRGISEKINFKIEISISQSTPVPKFGQFQELHFLGPNFPKKYE